MSLIWTTNEIFYSYGKYSVKHRSVSYSVVCPKNHLAWNELLLLFRIEQQALVLSKFLPGSRTKGKRSARRLKQNCWPSTWAKSQTLLEGAIRIECRIWAAEFKEGYPFPRFASRWNRTSFCKASRFISSMRASKS